MLSDQKWENAYAAAKTIVSIGDHRTVVAMDVWLGSVKPNNNGNERANEELRKHVAECRDKLKARLAKEKK